MATFKFSGSLTCLKPRQDRVNTLIVTVEAQDAVDNLENNWFGQCILSAASLMSGKMLTNEEASDIVKKDIEDFLNDTMKEINSREERAKKELTGDELMSNLGKLQKARARVVNNLRSAKSVLTGSLNLTDKILGAITDGGHVLWRADGSPRGKTEIQTLVKQAKSAGEPKETDYGLALKKGLAFAKALAVCTAAERTDVLRQFNEALADSVADEEGEDDDSEDEKIAA